MGNLIEVDVVDELHWYRMQTWGEWYAVQENNTFVDINWLGKIKTVETPKWIVPL